MRNKALLAAAGGVCAAGLVCFIVGLIVYLTSIGKPIPVIISFVVMATGLIIAVLAAVILLVTLLVTLLTKSKNK